jgi:hypothetical protein
MMIFARKEVKKLKKINNLAEAKAVERESRDELRAIIENYIATYPVGLQDKAREAFAPTLARIDAADARDDAVAGEVIATVDVG